jgi:riboflavin synthase
MFSGIIETMGTVAELKPMDPGVRLVVRSPQIATSAKIGASVCVNGCCLTVVGCDGQDLEFDAGPETLARTNLGKRAVGDTVNLERSLKIGDELGGHFVTGHIDGVGALVQRQDDADWSTLWFSMPPQLGKQMASKGSVAVDGISLTLVDVEPERFSVALIPHTLKVTTLGPLTLGDQVNLETDVLAKYVEKQLAGE